MLFSRTEKRLLYPLLAVMMLGLTVIVAILFMLTRHSSQTGLEQALQRETLLTTRLIETWLHEQRAVFNTLARQEAILAVLSGEASQQSRRQALQLLATAQQEHSFLETIFLVTPQGKMTLFAGATGSQFLAPATLQSQPFFKQVMRGEQVVSSSMKSPLTGNQVFLIVTPIMAGNQVAGMVAGAAPCSSCAALFTNRSDTGGHGVNQQDANSPLVLLTDHQSGSRLASSRDQDPLLPGLEEFVRQHGKNAHQGVIHQNRGKKVLTFVRHLQQAAWTLTLSRPVDSGLIAFLRANALALSAILASLLLFLLAHVLLFKRLVIGRLEPVAQAITQVRAGDLGWRIGQAPGHDDEISRLIAEINEMIDQMEASRRGLDAAIQARKTIEQKWAGQQCAMEDVVAQRNLSLQQAIKHSQQIAERLARVEKLEMIGSIAGDVAHDLNNVLSGVVSYPDLLLRQVPEDSPLSKPLHAIRRSGEKAVAIIQDLLTLARRGMDPKEAVSLDRVVQNYMKSPEYMRLCEQRPDIEVLVQRNDPPQILFGSALHLAKTVENLVDSAAALMPDGGRIYLGIGERTVDTPLRLYEHVKKGRYVVLTVENQGGGLAPEDLRQVFEPYYTKKIMGISGTGLGLPVVRATVRDHDGFIDCVNLPESGVRFTLFFPATAQQD